MASMYKNLPSNNQNLKHLFSISFAIFALFGLMDLSKAFWIMIFNSALTYGILYFIKGPWGPKLVFLFVLGHLSINHLFRQWNKVSLERYDPTGPHMVLVMKLTSFAFNVYDGRRPIKELTPHQQSKSIPSLPSLLEFLGYIFFFGGFLIGPSFDFMEYRRFVNMEMYRIDKTDNNEKHKFIKDDGKLSKRSLYVIPNGFIPAMRKLVTGLLLIVCLVTFGGKYPFEWTLSEEYKNLSFVNRLWYVQVAAFCARFRYYVIWLLAEGSCILSGIGFNGYDGNGYVKWNRVTNIDIIGYETADNIKQLLESWNMNTNKWLKNYVYLRVTQPGQKPDFFSTITTFGISAIWHGFYPGYYLTFITGAFVQNLHRKIHRTVRPIFLTNRFAQYKPLYNFLGWLTTQIIINYLVVSFMLLTLENSLYVWKLIYFCGHVIIILANVFFWLGAGKFCKRIIAFGGGVLN
ncbi:MBOAT, membrane-bound O-acyltransferase family-domain-containing protein [Gigaspora rosea]|uniref:MBOAT, membrane-bound O-acyltransferase family-domain-containing protein n=1 Tax=Gigaspora rosea TaxID=44941 RepID=A0A397UWK1_9GLOM|nr:MBOAT, membrane-bound O-acyltransferase family-domain-containing protein [Gigaspora rosea]